MPLQRSTVQFVLLLFLCSPAVAQDAAEIDKFLAGDGLLVPEVGSIGQLKDFRVDLTERHGDTEAMVNMRFHTDRFPESDEPAPRGLNRALDANSAAGQAAMARARAAAEEAAARRKPPRTVLLRGVDLSKAPDGQEVSLEGQLLRVAGTERYLTVLGDANTVLVVEKVSQSGMDAIEAEKQRRAEAAAAAAKEEADRLAAEEAAREEARYRVWTSANGKFTTEAKFIKSASGKVTLGKRDGKQVTVPLASLSDADQKYVRDGKWKSPPVSKRSER